MPEDSLSLSLSHSLFVFLAISMKEAGRKGTRMERERKLLGGIGKFEYSSFVPNSLARVPRKIKGLMNAIGKTGGSRTSAIIIKLHGDRKEFIISRAGS